MFLSIFSMILSLPSMFSSTAELSVTIHGMEEYKGVVRIGLYEGADNFLVESSLRFFADVSVTNSEVTHVFADLPAGEYAVSVYHDANDNHKLDKNFMGIPSEGYGFGNDARGMFGPPDYEDVMIRLIEGESRKMRVRVK